MSNKARGAAADVEEEIKLSKHNNETIEQYRKTYFYNNNSNIGVIICCFYLILSIFFPAHKEKKSYGNDKIVSLDGHGQRWMQTNNGFW